MLTVVAERDSSPRPAKLSNSNAAWSNTSITICVSELAAARIQLERTGSYCGKLMQLFLRQAPRVERDAAWSGDAKSHVSWTFVCVTETEGDAMRRPQHRRYPIAIKSNCS